MEEKKIGGKRDGSGRKPIADKREQLVLYVPKSKIDSYGGKEAAKDKLYRFMGMEVPKKRETRNLAQKNEDNEVLEVAAIPKLTKEQIAEQIRLLEAEKKEEQAKKCPGYMNPRQFALSKESKIDEIDDRINALRML